MRRWSREVGWGGWKGRDGLRQNWVSEQTQDIRERS